MRYDATEFQTCPVNYFGVRETMIVNLYAHYREGRMLYEGGLNKQPAGYIDAMMIVDAIFKHYENEAMSGQNRRR